MLVIANKKKFTREAREGYGPDSIPHLNQNARAIAVIGVIE